MHKLKLPNISAAFSLLALILFAFQLTKAQSSLFNIPTTDVMETGKLYLEADFDTHIRRIRTGGFRSYGAMAIYGIRRNLEIGVNGYYAKAAEEQPVELQPNAKWQVYQNESNGISIAVGAVAYIPVSHRPGSDTLGSVYGAASKKIKGKFGPRLTGGGYANIGQDKDAGNKNGFLAGLEQAVSKRVMFIADWKSGNNRFGYAAAGFGITMSANSYLYTAYYFGNSGRGNNSLGIYYGYIF